MTEEKKEPGRILVVDDDRMSAELLKTKLSVLGYDVTVAYSAEEAIAADKRVRPHLILLDIVLPEMSGFEACRKFNEIHADRYVPVILVTSMNDVESKIQGLESGAYDYVAKPFDTQELLARVRSAMRTKKLYDELSATREKLTEAEKLAELGKFVTTIHHEINNPLQAILLSAENMMLDLEAGNVSRDDLEIVLKSCHRIQEVLQKIMTLKRVRSAPYLGGTDMLDLDKSSE
ncbi:MAG: response regulator [Candidatus Abyssobacteria bacterium SURF_17]|uniref:histidine kinase n=1 Tax=Candidatus Abyssobacteria bacterium SURF_17 TaxID=2093361 RepID=A0A419ESH7_9BACT|nr:MAG: response regulator [Candidatus Abyssubacteria bacterium SURF_17]